MPMNGHNNNCGCTTCTMDKMVCGGKVCGHSYNHLIKMILMLFILMMVFCFGFRLGEISRGIHGGNNMMYRGGYNDDFGGVRMMKITTEPATVIPTPAQ